MMTMVEEINVNQLFRKVGIGGAGMIISTTGLNGTGGRIIDAEIGCNTLHYKISGPRGKKIDFYLGVTERIFCHVDRQDTVFFAFSEYGTRYILTPKRK
jgi:hypothetical protein